MIELRHDAGTVQWPTHRPSAETCDMVASAAPFRWIFVDAS